MQYTSLKVVGDGCVLAAQVHVVAQHHVRLRAGGPPPQQRLILANKELEAVVALYHNDKEKIWGEGATEAIGAAMRAGGAAPQQRLLLLDEEFEAVALYWNDLDSCDD